MSNPDLLLEICVDSLESIKNAIAGGADRLELCSALSEGGLTPSLGLVKLTKRLSSIPVFAMLRIRGGDFVYEPEEIDAMLGELGTFKTLGIDGFVFGALTSTNHLDTASCKRIIEAAHPLPVTFHRAFDDASYPLTTLDSIVQLGFARVLTSGQAKSAPDGIELLAELVEKAGDRIVVMPGAGITAENIGSVREGSGAREFHGSAKRPKTMVEDDSGKVKVGTNNGVAVTDPEIVRLMKKILKEKSL